jgi:hypothetical protein
MVAAIHAYQFNAQHLPLWARLIIVAVFTVGAVVGGVILYHRNVS